jgi:hypothetical protein
LKFSFFSLFFFFLSLSSFFTHLIYPFFYHFQFQITGYLHYVLRRARKEAAAEAASEAAAHAHTQAVAAAAASAAADKSKAS